jgi:opacity protein-like surface antigen
MKKSLTLLAAVAVATLSSSAFADSFGVRFGYPLGIQYTAENSFGKEKDLRISGAVLPLGGLFLGEVQGDYLINKPLGDTKGLNLFYGGGAHISFLSGYGSTLFAPGGQFTGGLEFKLDKTLSIFLDTSVGVSYYVGSYGFIGYDLGIGYYTRGALGLNFKL